MVRRLQPPYPPPLLPPARYQAHPMKYQFPRERQTRYGFQPGHLPLGPPPWLRRWRSRLRLWRVRFRLRQARWGQAILDRLWGLPHQRADPEGASLRVLITGLLLIVLFQMGLLLLAASR